ncbi:MAG TPA: hypothetical protein DCL35_03195 [Candidatus Omnitrophica bacterium]|nr:hypothetical protein [Candidatus Omnitrophota bacterium]
MGFFLVLMSLALIVAGVVMIMSPKKVVKLVSDILKAKDPRVWGTAPLAVGVLLLFSASASALSWLIVLLGLSEIAKAVYLFLTPAAKIRAHWWFGLSDNGHRALGILVLILGVIIFISRV